MALKGHTKIELTNVNTGEVKVYEDDNMVTNALENYFQTLGPFGGYTNLVTSQSLSNFTKRFTNGLFLFDKPLEERVDNILPPGGTQLTGRGSTQIYDGIDKTMGSYSSASKSLYNGHGYEHVWEFNTSQANGKIACACLTTSFGGKTGTGVKYSFDNAITAPNSNFDSSMFGSAYTRLGATHKLVDINPDENYCLYVPNFNTLYATAKYYIHSNYGYYNGSAGGYVSQADLNQSILNTHDLLFYKWRVPFNNLSLFEYDHQPELIETIKVHLNELDDIITDAMKTYGGNVYYYNYDIIVKNNYIYFCFSYHDGYNGTESTARSEYNTIANSVNNYIWKINIKTFTVEKFFEVKNIVTGNKNGIGIRKGTFLNTVHNATYPYSTFYITDNEFLLTEATFSSAGTTCYGLCKIDLNNPIDFDWITYLPEQETAANWGHNHSFSNIIEYNDKLYAGLASNGGIIYCIDCIDNTYYHVTNQPSYFMPQIARGHIYPFKYNNYLFLIQQVHQQNPQLFFMPNMLVTINNLPQEIIKSPEQTMKVTYTIIDDNYKIDD